MKRIFSWFRSFFQRAETFDIYKPQERLIYRYFNGKDEVPADPLLLWKKVMAVGPELSIDIKVSTSPSKGAAAAHTELLSKVRGIFNLKTLDDGGLSELETVELFNHFLIYCERLKKNTSRFATSSSNSVDSVISSMEDPPTRNSSDSGSTASVPSTDVPTQPPSEPPPPLEPSN